jgi:hypothetical protein
MFSAATKTGSQPSVAYNYIEDVFSTYLYTGNSSTQTINNGIDLAGKGGLVWTKDRSATASHQLHDTVRGPRSTIFSNTTSAAQTSTVGYDVTSFNSNGFSLGPDEAGSINTSGNNYCSWTFRKQPKFFDIVTYTGNGVAGRTVSHNLGTTPGMIIVKRTDTTGSWYTYHRSLGATQYLVLNTTGAAGTATAFWNDTAPTSSVFTVGDANAVNSSGNSFVAYIFAHNAGGFGTTGTDNVISCGSFTTDSAGSATVNLGYEPQYVMIKSSSATGNWFVIDNMRGFSRTQTAALQPNLSNAEIGGFGDATYAFFPTATGFESVQDLGASTTYIYMAIRRPMKVPTDATTVFSPVALSGNSSGSYNATINPDLTFAKYQAGSQGWWWTDRLRGNGITLDSSSTSAEASNGYITIAGQPNNTVATVFANGNANATWNFSRRPGFFDEVVASVVSGAVPSTAHNLGVVPELIIMKDRKATSAGWGVGAPTALGVNYYLVMNTADAAVNAGGAFWNPTSTMTGDLLYTSGSAGQSVVVYLFATCFGVSKVGSYTGNGTTQAISCGFTGGARFVLIKRTDSTGGWYVYDTARGMTTLTDPYLQLNSTAAETATLGSVTTTAGGFTVNASILSAINTNSASYIFLAIA